MLNLLESCTYPDKVKRVQPVVSVGINSGVIRVERIFDPDGSRAGMVINLTDHLEAG